jgi:gamma-glutamyltranspeptidase
MVSTSSPLAVEAALWALDQGGSAVDAAIASDAVLGVVQPFWTGIGGDLFCLVAEGTEVVGFNGSGPAPRGLDLGACQAAAAAPGGGAQPRARILRRPVALDALRAAGFEVLEHLLPPADFGAGQLIRSHDDGWFEGGADSRRDGVAFGR